jgi:hypothetical protein
MACNELLRWNWLAGLASRNAETPEALTLTLSDDNVTLLIP